MSRNEKIAAYIGFSVKSGKIAYGYESVLAYRKKIYLVLCDSELSTNSLKKVERFVAEKSIKMRVITGLSEYFGGRLIKCAGFAEEHLAQAIDNELNNTVGGSN